MAISSIIVRGFGSYGSVNLLPTLGYSSGSGVALVYGPLSIAACDVFIPQYDQGVDVLFPTPSVDVFTQFVPDFDIELP